MSSHSICYSHSPCKDPVIQAVKIPSYRHSLDLLIFAIFQSNDRREKCWTYTFQKMTFTALCWWKSSAANLHVNFDIWQWKALRAVMWCEHNKPVPVAVAGPGQYPLPLCSQCSEVCEVPQSQTGQNLIQTMRSEEPTQSYVCLYLSLLWTIHWLPAMKEQWGKLS